MVSSGIPLEENSSSNRGTQPVAICTPARTRGIEVTSARLHEHTSLGARERGHDDGETRPECMRSVPAQLRGAHDRHADETEQDTSTFFAVNCSLATYRCASGNPNKRNRRIEQRGQSGGEILLPPEDEGVVDGDREESGPGQESPIARRSGSRMRRARMIANRITAAITKRMPAK